ncbi:FUSC family protein [Francisella uliginis]|uniref:Fusaric acid resistance protein n=1 Tax=Francisella uliginis TaxID=573570 RepID=A0A1L4BS37_9GAMM|nr:FUSC family protein [Francisella uliginis]API86653.1 fusaric acid resistance protein [Francisella uliginis]
MTEKIFTTKSFIYTLKGCIAITLALGISMSLDLDKPMWAMITALFLQLRPETGFIVEKAVLLVFVSLIGVVIGFIIVNLFLPYPALAILFLCVFIAITMYFSVSMSHPNFIYALTLANITCTIVVFYSIANPLMTTEQYIFHIGYSRITEIIIGSLCSCLVNYYIFPVKVNDTLKNHATKSFNLTIDYIKQVLSVKDFYNNERYNKQVENILNSLITLDNDLSASKYENLNSNDYRKFSNNIVELIQSAHILRKQAVKDKLDQSFKRKLKRISNDLDDLNTTKSEFTFKSNNFLIDQVIIKFNKVINSYQQINKKNSPITYDQHYYSFKNYNNILVTFFTISRTIFLLIFLSLFWINTEGNSSLLMMLVIPCLLSQIFVPAPNSADLTKKSVIGIIISIPISIFVTLNLLAKVVGYFELLILVLVGTLFLGIITMTHQKFQAYSLGFCLGVISLVQPSNHMNFEISKSLTVGLSAIFGCVILWLTFKLYPHSPYSITRKLAVSSIVKDIKELQSKQISKEQYQSRIVKKILCIYKNRQQNSSSERDIEFALKSLTKSI